MFGLGCLQHVFELPDEDGVGVLEEQVKVPQQNQGLLLQILYGDQGFQRVVGGVVVLFWVSTRPSTALQKTRLYLSSWAMDLSSPSVPVQRECHFLGWRLSY